MKNQRTRIQQRGSTLVVALLMLVIILMMGISAMISSDTQSKLTGNLQFEDIAFNVAGQALAAGENLVASQQGATTAAVAALSCYYTVGLLESKTAPNNDPLTMDWSTACVDAGGGRYIIQKISANVMLNGSSHSIGGRMSTPPVMVDTYLITAQGLAARGTTKYLQSYYSVLL